MCQYKELHTITISEDVEVTDPKIKHDLYDSFLDYSSDNSVASSESECKFVLYAVLDQDVLEERNSCTVLNTIKKMFCIY